MDTKKRSPGRPVLGNIRVSFSISPGSNKSLGNAARRLRRSKSSIVQEMIESIADDLTSDPIKNEIERLRFKYE